MEIELLRVLQLQRELYDQPRGMGRFKDYLRQMTGGTDDVVLPIVGMNPMGKERAIAAYDSLLSIRAEDLAEQALARARARLASVPGRLRVALVVQDDAEGTWSQPETRESDHWKSDASARRAFAPAHFLSSEAPYRKEVVAPEVSKAVYRIAWIQRKGIPRTLEDVLDLEGNARLFAGETPAARASPSPIDAFLASRDWSVLFAAMYGDASAERWGYKPLGVLDRGGFDVALARAAVKGHKPEDALR